MDDVVIISSSEDAHLPYVQRHMEDDCVVIDPQRIIGGEELSYAVDRDICEVRHKGRVLSNVKGVWYRKPYFPPSKDIPVKPGSQEYSASALFEHIRILRSQWPKACWVSDYYAVQRAEDKHLQLRLAALVGFHVPATIMTSSEARASEFIARYGLVIVKSLAGVFPQYKQANSFFFARKVDATTSLKGLQYAPAIFQECIDSVADIRVTVVGDRVFPALREVSESERNGVFRDWRQASTNSGGDFVGYPNLDADVAQKCVTLVKKLGLRFGAIDLVQDKAGRCWFLENNPNGQWAFIEKATGQPIGWAIADVLTRHD